jgi:hypothetical protein
MSDLQRIVENFGRWLGTLTADERLALRRDFREAAYAKASTGDPEAIALVQVFDPAYLLIESVGLDKPGPACSEEPCRG